MNKRKLGGRHLVLLHVVLIVAWLIACCLTERMVMVGDEEKGEDRVEGMTPCESPALGMNTPHAIASLMSFHICYTKQETN